MDNQTTASFIVTIIIIVVLVLVMGSTAKPFVWRDYNLIATE